MIDSVLKARVDVSGAKRLSANSNQCFQGVIPIGKGFLVTKRQVNSWIKADQKNRQVLKLYSVASNLATNPHGKPDRWIVDFDDMSLEEASDYVLPFEHIKKTVKPARNNNRRKVRQENWWKFGENAAKMREETADLCYYFAMPEVSKWAIFMLCNAEWLPSNKNKIVASEDFYILGILTSQIHRFWTQVKSSIIENRKRYTHTNCLETFPFPQNPTAELVEEIRDHTEQLHEYRTEQMEKKKWGITQLYNQFFHEHSSQLFKFHEQLNQLVMSAYNFQEEDDIVAQLLELNLELAEQEKQGKRVIGARSPYSYYL